MFVTQEGPVSEGALAGCPDLIAPEQQLIDSGEFVDDVDWKLTAEAGMEGYHIKTTHRKSFYPYGFDNLNVVETFGPSSRITFPFRHIEKLRDFVSDTGLVEDQAVVRAIQEGLASGANTHFTYGRFEKAIVHFHKTLTGLLASDGG